MSHFTMFIIQQKWIPQEVVLTVHIWWEFNIVNSKYGRIWVMLIKIWQVMQPAMDYDAIYGGCPNLQWLMMSPTVTKLYKPSQALS